MIRYAKNDTLNNSTIDTKNLVGENVDDMTKTFGTFKAATKNDYDDIYNTLLKMDESVAESTHNFLLIRQMKLKKVALNFLVRLSYNWIQF